MKQIVLALVILENKKVILNVADGDPQIAVDMYNRSPTTFAIGLPQAKPIKDLQKISNKRLRQLCADAEKAAQKKFGEAFVLEEYVLAGN